MNTSGYFQSFDFALYELTLLHLVAEILLCFSGAMLGQINGGIR